MRIAINMSQGEGSEPSLKESYLKALRKIGCDPVVIHPYLKNHEKEILVRTCKGLVMIGGPDIPPSFYGGRSHPTISPQEETKVDGDFCLLRAATKIKLPVLGICAGMQTIGCYFGGDMFPHVPEAGSSIEHQTQTGRHPIRDMSYRMKQIFQSERVYVNTRHHQVVCDPGSQLIVEAVAPDGFIEAVSHPTLPILGVQWHPEDLVDEKPMRLLFESFKRGYPK